MNPPNITVSAMESDLLVPECCVEITNEDRCCISGSGTQVSSGGTAGINYMKARVSELRSQITNTSQLNTWLSGLGLIPIVGYGFSIPSFLAGVASYNDGIASRLESAAITQGKAEVYYELGAPYYISRSGTSGNYYYDTERL
jgi:hypothetical protein